MNRQYRQQRHRWTALALALCLGACSQGERQAGVSVSLMLTPEPQDHAAQAAGSKTLINTEGTTITLQTAYLSMWSVELSSDCDQPGFAALRRWLPRLDWVISSAQAHSEAQPTLFGTPTVIDLLATDGSPQFWGLMNPPAADYCGASWQVLAADDDAEKLPTETDMVGLSLALEGHFGPEQQAFRVFSSRALTPSRRRFALPLQLDAQGQDATLELLLPYDRWFNGLDMAALSRGETNAITQLLQNISHSVIAQVEQPD